MKISVVVPVYGCPAAVKPLHERIKNTLLQITSDYEIILVNDGCPKNSWKEIQAVCSEDRRVIGMNLSRNFGQVNATNAGLEYASGENRKDNFFVKFCSRTFYNLYNYIVEGHYNPDVGNYCMVRKKIVEEYCAMPEHNKSFTTILSWMGYRTSTIKVEAEKRLEGKSSYNFKKRLDLAIDMLTFQSNKPLYFFIKIGLLTGTVALFYILYQVITFFTQGDVPEGWTSLVAIVCLIGSIQLVSMGVIGVYIGNIFNETKHRQSYFIQEILNGSEKRKKENEKEISDYRGK